ncbi:MAG: ABC transporter ATP-binding protein [Caldilineaceae bacterium]|nr:ABC transporter ATP-binding protein [Caldilineaceae bacterium]
MNGDHGMDMEGTVPAILTEELTRTYRMGGQDIPALRGVNLVVPEGRYMSLKGRSGSGKTTLLNCIGGLDTPTSGAVRIFGESIDQWTERKLTMWRRMTVGFVFQSFGLMPSLSAYENVELMLRMSGVKGRQRRAKAVECLELVGLTRWMHHRPFELSGGQQQRVAIARSLANSPRLILADEPTGELDTQTAREILGLFQKIVREQQVTVLMVTHDGLSDEYVDEILYLSDGAIAEQQPTVRERDPAIPNPADVRVLPVADVQSAAADTEEAPDPPSGPTES